MSRRDGHWSDCAIYRAPALEPGPCDCGGLDLAAYDRYVLITSLIPTPGSLARFIEDGVLPSAIEAKQPPPGGIAAVTSSTDLPRSHDGVSLTRGADSVDFDNASKPAIRNTQSLPSAERVTGDMPPHKKPPQ